MIYTPLTKKALKLCFEAHKDAVDKGGTPYVFHPYYIAERMYDEDTVCIALLHDVIEDTECTASELLSMGFNSTIVDAVVALTRGKNEDYKSYLARVGENRLAKSVKILDLLHNSDLSRLENPSSEDFARFEKYRQAVEALFMLF